jgi:hypothetical protein
MRQTHGCSQEQAAAILQNRIAISAAFPLTARRANGGSQTKGRWLSNWGLRPQTPKIIIKELYIIKKNRQDKNKNLSMKEKQKHRHGEPPRPPVGRRRKHQKSNQKGTTPQPLNPLQFQDHLVLETKPHFRIIIRLENAIPPGMSTYSTAGLIKF